MIVEPGFITTKGGHEMTAQDLLAMTQEQLDDLFKKSPPGPIPNGAAKGTAIIVGKFSPEIAAFVTHFIWQGKVFDGPHGTLINEISVLGIHAIVAEVYLGKSLIDGNDCIVLDYSKTSKVAGWVRDEIRLIAPNFYLGVVYANDKKLINFSLEFPAA
jgi:hypothetical protein